MLHFILILCLTELLLIFYFIWISFHKSWILRKAVRQSSIIEMTSIECSILVLSQTTSYWQYNPHKYVSFLFQSIFIRIITNIMIFIWISFHKSWILLKWPPTDDIIHTNTLHYILFLYLTELSLTFFFNLNIMFLHKSWFLLNV